MYQAVDGVAPDQLTAERNAAYLQAMKDGTEMSVVSGFRVYEERADSQIDRGGDAPAYLLTYAAWEPAGVPPVEEPEEEE